MYVYLIILMLLASCVSAPKEVVKCRVYRNAITHEFKVEICKTYEEKR